MSTCTSCGAELRPEWKYCIMCGTPVIPGAIRPSAAGIAVGNKIGRYAPLAFSIGCFVLAGLVIAWLVVNVWT